MLKNFGVTDSLTEEDKDDVTIGFTFFDFIFIQIVCRPSFKTIEHEIIQCWSRRVLWVVGYITYVTLPRNFFSLLPKWFKVELFFLVHTVSF